MLIYFVEDDQNISYIIGKTLEKMSLEHKGFINGEEFKKEYILNKPDLILLDIMLPDISGLDLLKFVRNDNKEVPIIILSALFSEMDKVKAFDLGADDYMTKPFGILELTSRIQAKLRKVKVLDIIVFGNLEIDLKKYEIRVNENNIAFTNKEFEILKYLIIRKDDVLSKEKIFKNVWNTNYMGETRTLDMHIKSIRNKLKEFNSNVFIETVYGVGYKVVSK